jgi:hypothetical protein
MTNLVLNCPKNKICVSKGQISNPKDYNHNTFSSVPTNSEPQENARGPGFIHRRYLATGGSNAKSSTITHRGNVSAAPNPIKHWRKQLMPAQGTSSGKVSVGQVMDRPGGTNHLDKSYSSASDCMNCQHTITNYINKDAKCFEPGPDNCITDSVTGKKTVLSNPARIRRPGSTIINKKYYTTSSAYLKSRVKTYDQRLTLSAISNEESPPTFNSVYCTDQSLANCTNNMVKVIYKPNNSGFSTQGAVSNSNRLVKLKYDTIRGNKSCCNIQTANFGSEGVTALQYRGNFEAPYYAKRKMNLPEPKCDKNQIVSNRANVSLSGRKPTGGSGIHTVCFKTANSDLQHNKSSLLSSLRGVGTGKIITPQYGNCELLQICKDHNVALINKLGLDCGELPINTENEDLYDES